jgi:hypothetical protein
MSNYGRTRLHNFQYITTIFANIAVIAGIIFAIIQIDQSTRSERRRVAIEAVKEVRTNDFLKAYARLKTAYIAKNTKDNSLITDDLNYVMNVYDNIAVLYIYNIADRCIIKNSIYPAVEEVYAMLTFFSYPEEYKKNFNTLKNLLVNDHCN